MCLFCLQVSNTHLKRCSRLLFSLKKKHRIVIIGAGPTALGAATRLFELGVERSNTQIIILEQNNFAGGLAKSMMDSNGFLWDMGGHVQFSHYPYFDRTLERAIPHWNKLKRVSYAFMKDSDSQRRFIPYPVQYNIHLMAEENQRKCLKGLERITEHPVMKKPVNFDQWLVKNFGEELCDVFMRKYNKKVWTVEPQEMNAVWVGERVAVPDIAKIKEKIAAAKRGNLVEESNWGPNSFFKFPKYGGTGVVWRTVAKLVPQSWFHYNHKVVGVNMKKKSVEVLVDGAENTSSKFSYVLPYDTLISTAPLDDMINMANDDDARTLDMKKLANKFVYSHTHVIGIGLSGQPPSFLADKCWMYFPDNDVPFYRITVFSLYSSYHVPVPGKYWSLMGEAAEPKLAADHDYWTEKNLLNLSINALVNYGYIKADQVVSKFYHRLDHGYPVPFLERDQLLDVIQPWLQENSIYSRGRFGGWRYEVGNQDHSLMQGVEVADLIMRRIPEETYPDANLVNSMKASNRFLNCNPYVNPHYEIVVSHFDNDDLSKLKRYARFSHIYHKGAEVIPRFNFQRWEKLPDVGIEAHTYLHHIITNYDHISDITVFIHGGGISESDHKFCYDNIWNFIKGARKKKLFMLGPIDQLWDWEEDVDSKTVRESKMSIGEFWHEIFGYSHPGSINYPRMPCFGVHKNGIYAHPKHFYEKIYRYVSDHSEPEESYYLKKLWASIFE